MKPPVETIRISSEARDKLIQLKRVTGMKHWNELCRWALCLAMANRQNFTKQESTDRGSIEMSWGTFAGQHSDILATLILYQWSRYEQTEKNISIGEYFHGCLEYGIAILAKAIQGTDENNVCAIIKGRSD